MNITALSVYKAIVSPVEIFHFMFSFNRLWRSNPVCCIMAHPTKTVCFSTGLCHCGKSLHLTKYTVDIRR